MSHRLYWQECPGVMSDPLPLSWSSYTQVKYSAWRPVLCEFHRWPLGLLLQGKVSPPSQDIVFLSMVCMEFVLSVFSVSHRKGKKITRLTQKSTEFMLYCFRLLWYWSLQNTWRNVLWHISLITNTDNIRWNEQGITRRTEEWSNYWCNLSHTRKAYLEEMFGVLKISCPGSPTAKEFL